MRKVFAFLCALLLAVHFLPARQNSSDVFVFDYGGVTELSRTSFSASLKVTSHLDKAKSFGQPQEVGICFSETSGSPTIQDEVLSLGTSLGNYTFCIDGLEAGTTCHYRAYVKEGDSVWYGDVRTETTLGEKATCLVSGHKFVGLGLPSGVLWAETNIGAEAAADDGDFLAWGETKAKPDYSWAIYKYGTLYSNISKYYSADGKTILEKEDDAACASWGSSCRMPTKEEFEELSNSDNCTWTWTSQTNSAGRSVMGYKVTNKKNHNSIFLPASGCRMGKRHFYQDSDGHYWCSSLYTGNADRAYFLCFGGNYHNLYDGSRYDGRLVRPVAALREASPVALTASRADGGCFRIVNDGVDVKTPFSFSATCTISLTSGDGERKLPFIPRIGLCYSKENAVPTIKDECLALGQAVRNYSFTLPHLTSGTTYYYRVYVKLNGDVFYGDAVKVRTLGAKPDDKTVNGHKFIDLGLPSGMLWAETNMGAAAAADEGGYYAWGETVVKSDYSWSTYKYGSSSSNLTKYDKTDGKAVLEQEDDAARASWGSSCRIPTMEDFEELGNPDNCTWTWTSQTNSAGRSVIGYKVTSKKNHNSIFLPVTGYRFGNSLHASGSNGHYWIATPHKGDFRNAAHFRIGSGFHGVRNGYRCCGRTIRPVAEP